MRTRLLVSSLTLLAAASASAALPSPLLGRYDEAAAATEPAYRGFSAARGHALYERRGKDWSCVSCHTDDPRRTGKHAVTGKPIRPLAPVANPARFTDAAKAEKWFRRNCRDVLGRECTALEKGDFITWLNSLAR
jgi:mono/diheme cytochrome c family protein